MSDVKIKQAASVSARLCDCPSFHIDLFDADDNIFAVASMSIEGARELVADMQAMLDGTVNERLN